MLNDRVTAHTCKQTRKQTNTHTGGQNNRKTNKQTSTHTGGQINIQTNKQAIRQKYKQILR